VSLLVFRSVGVRGTCRSHRTNVADDARTAARVTFINTSLPLPSAVSYVIQPDSYCCWVSMGWWWLLVHWWLFTVCVTAPDQCLVIGSALHSL